MIKLSIPSIVEVNTTNNSPFCQRWINFDDYLDNIQTETTIQSPALYTRQHLKNMKYCVEYSSDTLQME